MGARELIPPKVLICPDCLEDTEQAARPCHGAVVEAKVVRCPDHRKKQCHGLGSAHHHNGMRQGWHVMVPDHVCTDPVECDVDYEEQYMERLRRRIAAQVRREKRKRGAESK